MNTKTVSNATTKAFHLRPLNLAIAVSFALGLSHIAQAVDFPPSTRLCDLDGNNGFAINPSFPDEQVGFSVRYAGDINGDGLDDVIIGAPNSALDALRGSNFEPAGRGYVLFGTREGLPQAFDLAQLDGSNGFVIIGEDIQGRAGSSVSAAGDVNGDGLDDLIIGAPTAIFGSTQQRGGGFEPGPGRSYVVFGSASPFPQAIELSSLNGSNGFRMNGEFPGDYAGSAVAGAGDINGDGIDDIFIGAPNIFTGETGSSYVVYGRSNGFPQTLNLSSLNGNDGFTITGETGGRLGTSGDGVGDFNGDGFDDLIISDPSASPNGIVSGQSYLIFGALGGLPQSIEVSNLSAGLGFIINGEQGSDRSGRAVSAAGDVNGDGFDDVVIGAPFAEPNGTRSGRSYVLFGSAQPPTQAFELSELDASTGFAMDGTEGDLSGRAVAAAGDVNQDGLVDVLIGALGSDLNGPSSGRSYVVFGSSSAAPDPIQLSSLNGQDGFSLDGCEALAQSGNSVSSAGDFNGDGVADMLIGARFSSISGDSSGRAYIVFDLDRLFSDGFETESRLD